MKKAKNYVESNLEQAKQKLREKILSFERIGSLPGKENLTQEEYEDMVSFIETLAEVTISNYLRDPTTFSEGEQ